MGCCPELDVLIERAYEVMNKSYEKSAKLTTKQRKNLKKSAFCGPGKSFPVNDCAHYTAALRLLNRSKFSDSTKAKIRACVMRKGKAMGCGGAKKEKSAFTDQEIQTLIDSEIFASTLALIEEAEKNPGMDLTYNEQD